MLKSLLVPCLIGALLGAGLTARVAAGVQESGGSQPATAVVHIEGCVFPESALTATAPVVSVATAQAFVLTDIKVIAGDIDDEDAAGIIYTVKTTDPAPLRSLNQKRAGVTGRVTAGTPRPSFDIVSIREISGSCPPVPRVP